MKIELDQLEKEIISILRSMNPHEKIEVSKDQEGRPDWYIVHRAQKIVLNKKTAN